MDEDKPADRYLYLSIGLGVAAVLIWIAFISTADAKVYLAAGVSTTVASAMFRVLVAVRAVERRLELVTPTHPGTPES